MRILLAAVLAVCLATTYSNPAPPRFQAEKFLDMLSQTFDSKLAFPDLLAALQRRMNLDPMSANNGTGGSVDAGGNPSIMVESRVNCADAPSAFGASISYSSQTRESGSRAFYQCIPGYKGRSKFVQCLSDGTWSVDNMWTGCHPVNCTGPPPSIPNATPRVSGNTFGSAVHYDCNPGFKLTPPNSNVTCNENGNWGTPTFTCEQVQAAPQMNQGMDFASLMSSLGGGNNQMSNVNQLPPLGALLMFGLGQPPQSPSSPQQPPPPKEPQVTVSPLLSFLGKNEVSRLMNFKETLKSQSLLEQLQQLQQLIQLQQQQQQQHHQQQQQPQELLQPQVQEQQQKYQFFQPSPNTPEPPFQNQIPPDPYSGANPYTGTLRYSPFDPFIQDPSHTSGESPNPSQSQIPEQSQSPLDPYIPNQSQNLEHSPNTVQSHNFEHFSSPLDPFVQNQPLFSGMQTQNPLESQIPFQSPFSLNSFSPNPSQMLSQSSNLVNQLHSLSPTILQSHPPFYDPNNPKHVADHEANMAKTNALVERLSNMGVNVPEPLMAAIENGAGANPVMQAILKSMGGAGMPGMPGGAGGSSNPLAAMFAQLGQGMNQPPPPPTTTPAPPPQMQNGGGNMFELPAHLKGLLSKGLTNTQGINPRDLMTLTSMGLGSGTPGGAPRDITSLIGGTLDMTKMFGGGLGMGMGMGMGMGGPGGPAGGAGGRPADLEKMAEQKEEMMMRAMMASAFQNMMPKRAPVHTGQTNSTAAAQPPQRNAAADIMAMMALQNSLGGQMGAGAAAFDPSAMLMQMSPSMLGLGSFGGGGGANPFAGLSSLFGGA